MSAGQDMQAVKKGRGFRRQIRFWLDECKPDENDLLTYLDSLNQKRLFSKTIRDGIRLIRDLRSGKVDVLTELFPSIGEKFKNAELEERIKRLEYQQIAAGSKLLLSAGDTPPDDEQFTRPMPVTKGNLSIEVTRVTSDKDEKSGWNSLISMSLLAGTMTQLSPEILQYALQKKRVPDKFKKEVKRIVKEYEDTRPAVPLLEDTKPAQITGGPKAMNVPQFSAPQFGDSELELMYEQA